MSARDAESGSSSYKGGSGSAGGLGNGGTGGGMGGGGNWGGGMGGGAGRNGGIGNRTGLTTGNRMFGGMAMGRPGGRAMNPGAFGFRPQAGIQQGPLSGMPRSGKQTPVPAAVAGVNPVPENVPLPPANVPNVFNQNYLNSIVDFRNAMKNQYGWGNAVPGPGPMTPAASAPKSSWSLSDYYNRIGQSAPPQNSYELSNYNWSGPRKDISTVSGGQGIGAWDRQNSSPSRPSSGRGWGGGLSGIWN